MTFVHLFINTNCNCVRLINSIIIINDMSEILRKILISLCLSLALSAYPWTIYFGTLQQ